MNRYQKYLSSFAVFLAIQIFAIVAFNWLVDPYKVSNVIKLYQFNQAKPEVVGQARLFKAIEIIRKKPEITLLGSSRTDLGLDPDYLSDRAYNLGILGGNMYEVLRYFQHAIANQPDLKQAILGIDFFMFNQTRTNQPDFQEGRLEKTHITFLDLFNTTFSLNAVGASFETIQSNRQKPKFDPYEENGMRNNQLFVKSDLPQGSIVQGFQMSMKKFLDDPGLYGNYKLSEAQLKNLQAIVELCQQKNIDLKIFISPSHALQWETLRLAGLWPTFEEWKREVAKITAFWDFSGYNSITTEPLSEEMNYYLDSSHYNQKAGNLILDRILQGETAKLPSDFGVWVSSENIASHFTKLQGDRQQWVDNHPEMLEFAQKIARQLN
jgi:hypothetical protein